MSDKIEQVGKGRKASEILDNDVIKEAFAVLEEAYINDWKTSKVDDVVKREKAYARMSVLFDFRAQLQSFVDTGKIAGKQLEKSTKI